MIPDWANRDPTLPLPGTLWGKVAFWLVGTANLWLFGLLVILLAVCG